MTDFMAAAGAMLNNLNPETPKLYTLVRLPRQGSCNSDIKPLARTAKCFQLSGRKKIQVSMRVRLHN